MSGHSLVPWFVWFVLSFLNKASKLLGLLNIISFRAPAILPDLRRPSDRFPARPHITERPKNVTALVNTTVIFSCPILSDLEPHIEWVKLGLVDLENMSIPENVTKLKVPRKQERLPLSWWMVNLVV